MKRLTPILRLGDRGLINTGLGKNLFLLVALVAGCAILAGLLTGSVNIPLLSALPPMAVLAVVVLAATTPLLLTRWRITFWGLIAWLMVEDLIRKFAGNSLGVYAIKQIIFVLLIVGLVMDPEVRGAWRQATGTARIALYCLMTWAIVMSVPSFFVDWKLPLLGLGADFVYVPLVVAGFVLARERKSLQVLLLGVAAITSVAVLLGVIQAVIGPSFLDPGRLTPGLQNLVTIRSSATVSGVFRPTGTFVDPGRYASLAFVSLVISLCAGMVHKGKQRVFAYGCAGLAMAGLWLSGGRAPVVVGSVVVLVAVVVPRAEGGRRSFLLAGTVSIVLFLAFFLLLASNPGAFTSRLTFYTDTLDPSRRGNEWAQRWENYTDAIFYGIEEGGLIGNGTGAESIGKQYFFSGSGGVSSAGQYTVESGYGAVLVEWGMIGLAFWLIWVVRWLGRFASSVRGSRAGPFRSVGAILTAYAILFLVVQFYAGIAVFQNYIGNAFFWLLSGVAFALPFVDPATSVEEERVLVGVG